MDIDPSAPRRPVDYEKLAKTTAGEILKSSYASLDAAVLVFSHSLLDATAFDYCRVTALHAPRDWEQDLRNTQVQLVDARNKSYDEILQAKLDERLERLERESLLAKVDRLFIRCQPPAGWSPMTGYSFDRKQIEVFDEQRHEIVHGNALGKPLRLFELSEQNLFYLQQTAMYCMGLVNLKYGLQLDPKHFEEAIKARS